VSTKQDGKSAAVFLYLRQACPAPIYRKSLEILEMVGDVGLEPTTR